MESRVIIRLIWGALSMYCWDLKTFELKIYSLLYLANPIFFQTETGKKHRKHRAPICMAGKTTDDVTLLRGKKAGNFTNIGDVGDFEMCIKRCCQTKTCDLAFKSAETCFLVNCFDKDSCKTTESLDDIFSPRMCFVKRHLSDEEKGNQLSSKSFYEIFFGDAKFLQS